MNAVNVTNVVHVIEDDTVVDLTQLEDQDEDQVEDQVEDQDGIVMDFEMDVVTDFDIDEVVIDFSLADVAMNVDVDGLTCLEQAHADALYESILEGECCLKPVRGEDGRMCYTLKVLKNLI